MGSVRGGIALILAANHFDTLARKAVAVACKVFSIKVASDFS
jgi:hypothetical protein